MPIFANMQTALNMNDILSKVKKLDREDQLTLLEKLVTLIRSNATQKNNRLSKISGIGSKIWQSTDIDDYIEQERKW